MIAHNCPKCRYATCKGECNCRCMPLCSMDQAERRAKRVPEPNSYMDGYLRGCSLVHNLLQRTGWAGAKGQIKRIIRVYALDVLPEHYTNWDRGRIDAILDSVN